ncbi:MAG: protocatechuate 3,4-dioxygenase subunit alpha [Pseudomonadota bacterium]
MNDMRPNTKVTQETASQTAGPYVHIGLAPRAAGFDIYEKESGHDIAGPHADGQRIRVEGIVWDGNGEPVKDVLLEVWQPNAHGIFADRGPVEPGFRGWGRIACNFDTGVYTIDTVKPGAVGDDAPHLTLWIVARGINVGLNTRMYFPEDTAAHATDAALSLIPDADARGTLLPEPGVAEEGHILYRFDIRLQGDGETVFFDI